MFPCKLDKLKYCKFKLFPFYFVSVNVYLILSKEPVVYGLVYKKVAQNRIVKKNVLSIFQTYHPFFYILIKCQINFNEHKMLSASHLFGQCQLTPLDGSTLSRVWPALVFLMSCSLGTGSVTIHATGNVTAIYIRSQPGINTDTLTDSSTTERASGALESEEEMIVG